MRFAGPLLSSLRIGPRWSRFWRDERGATLVEYGLLLTLLICALLAVMTQIGVRTGAKLNTLASVIGSGS